MRGFSSRVAFSTGRFTDDAFGDTKKTPIIPVDNGGFFDFLKKIGSGNDDARHISQAAWMHGMRKSLSPLYVSRVDVTDVMVEERWLCY